MFYKKLKYFFRKDLISIFLSYDGGGALSNGICATIIATPN